MLMNGHLHCLFLTSLHSLFFLSETCRHADELGSFSAVGRGVLAKWLPIRPRWKKVLVTSFSVNIFECQSIAGL